METQLLSRIRTIEEVDCLVCIFRKEIPEKRTILIWNVIIPNQSAATPDAAQCQRWVNKTFGTEEEIDAIAGLLSMFKRCKVDMWSHVGKPGTPIQRVADDFEKHARSL